jgi:hypothetical protein
MNCDTVVTFWFSFFCGDEEARACSQMAMASCRRCNGYAELSDQVTKTSLSRIQACSRYVNSFVQRYIAAPCCFPFFCGERDG